MSRRGDIAIITIGTVLLVGLAFAPLADLRVARSNHSLRLFDLSLLGIALPIAALGLGVTAVIQIGKGTSVARGITIGYAGLAIASALGIALFEAADTLIPRRWLPPTIRRFTISSGAQWSGWVAAVVLAALALSSAGNFFRLLERAGGRMPGESAGPYSTRLAALAGAITGTVLVGLGRQSDWLTVKMPSQNVHVSTWAIPFVGPATLVALILTILATCLTACRVWTAGAATLGAALSWALATLCALALAASGLFTRHWAFQPLLRRIGVDTGGAFDVVRGSGATLGLAGATLLGLSLATYLAAVGASE